MWFRKKKEKKIIAEVMNYNPFRNDGHIEQYQLTLEEMKEKGFTYCTYSVDLESGYYAWVYK